MVNLSKLVAGGLGVIYIVSPVDLIPEAVTGPIGYADDAVVGWISFNLITEGLGWQDVQDTVKEER